VSVGGPETRVHSALNDFSRGSHELLGVSVLTLTLVRLCWRTIFPSPKGPEMPAWREVGAKLGQWAFYALLVLVPVTAIVGAWLEGHPLTLLAVGNIQPWLAQSPQLGLALGDIHG
jgi:cytochrome b561